MPYSHPAANSLHCVGSVANTIPLDPANDNNQRPIRNVNVGAHNGTESSANTSIAFPFGHGIAGPLSANNPWISPLPSMPYTAINHSNNLSYRPNHHSTTESIQSNSLIHPGIAYTVGQGSMHSTLDSRSTVMDGSSLMNGSMVQGGNNYVQEIIHPVVPSNSSFSRQLVPAISDAQLPHDIEQPQIRYQEQDNLERQLQNLELRLQLIRNSILQVRVMQQAVVLLPPSEPLNNVGQLILPPSSSTCEPAESQFDQGPASSSSQTLPESQPLSETPLPVPSLVSNPRPPNPGTDISLRGIRKRSRMPLLVERRMEIIRYSEQHPNESHQKLADLFGVPRTTLYGILKSKDKLFRQPNLTPNSYRITEPRFRILDDILVFWLDDLASKRIRVNRKTIMAQALDIHRMLDGLLVEPLPPCLHSPGWLKSFKNRRREVDLSLTYNNSAAVMDETDAIESTRNMISLFRPNDIYTCEMTSFYLSMAPLRSQRGILNKPDTSSATAVFCFNASGIDKREPLVLVREGAPNAFRADNCHEIVMNAEGEDLTRPTLLGWLQDFDRSLNRPILLVVDEAIWGLLSRDQRDSQSLLNIKVVKQPASGASRLPLSEGIAKMFKEAYYRNLLHAFLVFKLKITDNELKLDSLEEYLSIIWWSWSAISQLDIKRNFQPFLNENGVRTPSIAAQFPGFFPFLFIPEEDEPLPLSVEFKTAFPRAPVTTIQYFDNLEKDSGPTGFLREKIRAMQDQPDFRDCFGTLNFGIVRVAKFQAMAPIQQYGRDDYMPVP